MKRGAFLILPIAAIAFAASRSRTVEKIVRPRAEAPVVTLTPEPVVERPALLRLAEARTPEACRSLAGAVRDVRDPARASDAVAALARHPNDASVDAFEALLRDTETNLVRLRALQGLLLMIRWGEGPAVDRARTVLVRDGAKAASTIERTSRVAALRYEARQVQRELKELH